MYFKYFQNNSLYIIRTNTPNHTDRTSAAAAAAAIINQATAVPAIIAITSRPSRPPPYGTANGVVGGGTGIGRTDQWQVTAITVRRQQQRRRRRQRQLWIFGITGELVLFSSHSTYTHSRFKKFRFVNVATQSRHEHKPNPYRRHSMTIEWRRYLTCIWWFVVIISQWIMLLIMHKQDNQKCAHNTTHLGRHFVGQFVVIVLDLGYPVLSTRLDWIKQLFYNHQMHVKHKSNHNYRVNANQTDHLDIYQTNQQTNLKYCVLFTFTCCQKLLSFCTRMSEDI